jgi:hypothetical protein
MNEDRLEDLKQFIDSRVSQAETRIDGKIEVLRKEMHNGFAGVADVMDDANEQVEHRLNKLEQKAA